MSISTTLRDLASQCLFEWLHAPPATKIEKSRVELGSVGDIVTCMIAHPSNDLLLLGTVHGKVIVWDPSRAEMIHSFLAHSKDVTRIVFSDDHSKFLTTSVDGFVHWWDQGFHRLQGYSAGSAIFCAAISPNGRELAAGGQDSRLRIWDVATGVLLHSLDGHLDPIASCVWPADGVVVTGGADGSLRAWEVDARRCIRQQKGHQLHVSQLLCSKQSGWYLSASWDQTIKLWNLHHRERFAFPAGTQAITGVALTPDEKMLVAAYWDGTLRIWNIESGKLVDEFAAHEESLIGCSILSGSHTLVTADQDGRLRGWSLAEMGVTRFVNQHSGEVYSIQYAPDNLQLLSVGYDGKLRIWDRAERRETGCLEAHSGPTTACAISPDNRFWAVGASDGTIRLWDKEEQTFEAGLCGHQQAVSQLVYPPGGDLLVSASWDMKLKLWSLESHSIECVFDGHTGEVSACDVSLDGRLLVSSSWDGTARVWDLRQRRQIGVGLEVKTLAGHAERVLCCAFSPDGSVVATGSADETVRIWPIEKTGEPRTLFGHGNAVTACRFTPDGKVLVTADRDGILYFWDAIQGQTLGCLRHDGPIHALAISPDGLEAAIGDEAGRVRFFELHHPRGPKWVAATSVMKSPPIWKRGAPSTEQLELGCVYCGEPDLIRSNQLGETWRCKKCGKQLRVCPKSLPPISD